MRKARVYLCARFGRRLEMRAIANLLRLLQFEISSRWIDAETDETSRPFSVVWSEIDTREIEGSDVLVFFSDEPGTPGADRGGRQVELGIAIGTRIDVLVVGKPENLFHHSPRLARVPGLADAVLWLLMNRTIRKAWRA